jgi:VCBS repeat-containing protein
LSIGEGPLTGTAQTSITIDRPPVVVGSYDLDTVAAGYPTGGSGAALTGDSDPDGDALTIMSVSDFRGTMAAGTGIAGAYGELTLEGDGSYTYYAYNTMAIDAAPTGTPPVDQFTFTVSYQMTWAMTHRPGHLVLRAGLVGRPRAERDSHTEGHSQ